MINLISSILSNPSKWPCPPSQTSICSFPFPILYFGDECAYKKSSTRVVTLSLNPSDVEFKNDRFPNVTGKASNTAADFKSAFDNYFKADPYWTWFNYYEHALNAMGASYSGSSSSDAKPDTALHIDLVPVATKPVWGGLTKTERSCLLDTYRTDLVHLIDNLDPHCILTSISQNNLEYFLSAIEAKIINRSYYTKGGKIVIAVYNVSCNGRALHTIIAGINWNTPFAKISKVEKQSIIKHITDSTHNLIASIAHTCDPRILYPNKMI